MKEVTLQIMSMQHEICSKVGDAVGSAEALGEIVPILKEHSKENEAQRGGEPDTNLVFYLLQYSTCLEKSGKIQESIDAFKEADSLAS